MTLPGGHALWADLREELLDSPVVVRLVVALDAAEPCGLTRPGTPGSA